VFGASITERPDGLVHAAVVPGYVHFCAAFGYSKPHIANRDLPDFNCEDNPYP
jgi:hypothetical protein